MKLKGEEIKLKLWRHIATLVSFYGLTRYTRLLNLPIFHDEAIHIRWATITFENPNNLFISAIDGKSPFFIWINVFTFNLFNDILLSGRAVSVAAGGFVVAGIYLIGKKLFSQTVGFLASLIYIMLPFSTIHDRMATMDSMVTAFATWMFLVSLYFFFDHKKYFVKGIILGLIMGLGFLTKTPFLMFFIYPALGVFLFSYYKDKKFWIGLLIAYTTAASVMAPYLLYEPPLRVFGTDNVFHNAQIINTLISNLLIKNSFWFSNLKEWIDYLTTYITYPILLVFVFSLIRVIKIRERHNVYLVLWFFLPSLAILFLGNKIYSRYFLFCIPPVALLVAYTLVNLSNEIFDRFKYLERLKRFRSLIFFISLCVLLFPSGYFDYKLINSPRTAGWSKKDRWQYTNSQYSGYGIRESVEFLTSVANEKPVLIFFTTTWGIPGDAIYLFLKNHSNIQMYEAWWARSMPIFPANLGSMQIYKSKYQKEIVDVLKMTDLNNKEVFFIARDHVYSPEELLSNNPNIKRVRSYNKLEKYYSFSIYRMDPSKKIYMIPNPSLNNQ